MMRFFYYTFVVGALIALGFSTYRQNYATQTMMRDVERLQADIGAKREELAILRAEWAYLNRPERLRALVDLNYARLGLAPMTPEQFGMVEQVSYPNFDLDMISNPVDVIGQIAQIEQNGEGNP